MIATVGFHPPSSRSVPSTPTRYVPTDLNFALPALNHSLGVEQLLDVQIGHSNRGLVENESVLNL